MDHRTSATPPPQTAWWDNTAVREAVVSFTVGFVIVAVAMLALIQGGAFR